MVYGKDLRLPKTSFSVIHMNQGYTQTAGKPGAPNNQIYGKLASQAKFGDCGQNPGAMTAGTHQENPYGVCPTSQVEDWSLQSQSYGQEVASWTFQNKNPKQEKQKQLLFFPGSRFIFSSFVEGLNVILLDWKNSRVVVISKRFLGLQIVFVGGHEQWATPPSKMYSRNRMKTSQTFQTNLQCALHYTSYDPCMVYTCIYSRLAHFYFKCT